MCAINHLISISKPLNGHIVTGGSFFLICQFEISLLRNICTDDTLSFDCVNVFGIISSKRTYMLNFNLCKTPKITHSFCYVLCGTGTARLVINTRYSNTTCCCSRVRVYLSTNWYQRIWWYSRLWLSTIFFLGEKYPLLLFSMECLVMLCCVMGSYFGLLLCSKHISQAFTIFVMSLLLPGQ